MINSASIQPVDVPSASRKVQAALIALAACMCMIVSAVLLAPAPTYERVPYGVAAAALGTVLYGAALHRSRLAFDLIKAPNTPLSEARPHWLIIGIALLVLSFLVVTSIASLTDQYEALRLTYHTQVVILIAGCLLLVWGVSGGRPSLPTITDTRAFILVVGIAIVAFALRSVNLDAIRWSIDEALMQEPLEWFDTTNYVRVIHPPPFSATLTMLYNYANSLTVDVFGNTLTGFRIVNAFIGVAGVLAVYEVGRLFFTRQIGVLAALILATFPPHLHFTRISIPITVDPVLMTFIFLFIGRGIRWNQRSDWAAAGVTLGFTQWFYEVGRLSIPVFIAAWCIWLVITRQVSLRAYFRGALIMGFCALVVALVVYIPILFNGIGLLPRLENASGLLSFWQQLFDGTITPHHLEVLRFNVISSWLVYTFQPDITGEFYGGNFGMIQPPVIPLFLLGIAFLVYQWRSPAHGLILWLLAITVAAMIVQSTGHHQRYLHAHPVVALLIALAIVNTLRLLTGDDAGLNRLRKVAAAAAVAVIALGQAHYFFGTHINTVMEGFWSRHTPVADIFDAAFRAAEYPGDNVQVTMLSDYPLDGARMLAMLNFLRDAPYEIRFQTPVGGFNPSKLELDRNYLIFVPPGNTEIGPALQALYGNAVQGPLYSPYGVPEEKQFMLYILEPVQKSRRAPQTGA